MGCRQIRHRVQDMPIVEYPVLMLRTDARIFEYPILILRTSEEVMGSGC